ncbi:MAG: SpoIID/LytB domain-containing protein [Bdellovibrio sp.]|nr:SpoIID/LytB domain-containing protein [Bdellovibrio sp.]
MLVLLVLWEELADSSLIPPAQMASPVKIRVRIYEKELVVTVRGFDLRLYTGINKTQLVYFANQLSEWNVQCQNGKIFLTQEHRNYVLPEPLVIESEAGFTSVQNFPYRETLLFYSKGKYCETINVLDIEKYLDGLVNLEFSAQWSKEAVAAQIIAARSYGYYQMLEARKNHHTHFDVEASVKDQLYRGSMHEHFRASQIVNQTQGLILMMHENQILKPIKAFYHSMCGGQTILPETVWGRNHFGFKKGVPCPFCKNSPFFKWEFFLSESDLKALIRQGVKDTGFPKDWLRISSIILSYISSGILSKWKLENISVSRADNFDRVKEIELHFKNRLERVIFRVSGNRFRSWLGANRLKSTIFQIKTSVMLGDHGWYLMGRGNGHGVGLCQWGAKVMGEKGYQMATILRHYYPDALIYKLW